MSVSIASNIFALKAQTQLSKATDQLAGTFERLSSGLRINKASDDAAGLAMADDLRADAAIAAVAIRNANDGISITSIVDSSLNEIQNILTRMAELAEQSSNGTYTTSQRSSLEAEFAALGSEVERIAISTKFNDKSLLSNSNSISIQVGLDSSSNSSISIDGVLGTLSSLGLTLGGSAELTYSLNDTTDDFASSAAATALDAVTSAISTLTIARGQIGASESRLSYAVSNIQVARENFVAAESRIRDADIAQEVADLVKYQVLQQGAAAILAQANLQPQIALGLLQ